MTKTLLRIIVLLLTAPMTLWSCDTELPDSPYDPSDSTAIWKVSIMGDSYSTPTLRYIVSSTVTAASLPELTKPYAKSIQKICKHYGMTSIVVRDIEMTDNHPTYAGMQSICEQVYAVLRGR